MERYILGGKRYCGKTTNLIMISVSMCLQSLLGVGIDIMTTSIKNVKL